MKQYDFENIIGSDQHHLIYLDESGEQQELSLKESCRILTEKYGLSEITDLLGNPVSKSRQIEFVCRADKSSDEPYYDFYDENGEEIRFRMEIRPGFLDYFRNSWRNRFYNRLEEFEKELRLFGYDIYME